MSTKPNENAVSTVLILFIIGASIISFILNLFATPDFIVWYIATYKSFLTPDPIIFKVYSSAFIWLYAIAGWRLWCKGKLNLDAKECKLFFLVLLLTMLTVMSTAGIRSPEVTLVLLIVLWFISFITMRSFAKTDKVAAFIVCLMLLWTTFEIYLSLVVLL
jgi:tryptophan-rich sensory protein